MASASSQDGVAGIRLVLPLKITKILDKLYGEKQNQQQKNLFL